MKINMILSFVSFMVALSTQVGYVAGIPQMGACCKNGNCQQRTVSTCDSGGGTFLGVGISCARDGNCPGACCNPELPESRRLGGRKLDEVATCVGGFFSANSCRASGGTFQGDGTTCDMTSCGNGNK